MLDLVPLCALRRRTDVVDANPIRQLLLQLEAPGTDQAQVGHFAAMQREGQRVISRRSAGRSRKSGRQSGAGHRACRRLPTLQRGPRLDRARAVARVLDDLQVAALSGWLDAEEHAVLGRDTARLRLSIRDCRLFRNATRSCMAPQIGKNPGRRPAKLGLMLGLFARITFLRPRLDDHARPAISARCFSRRASSSGTDIPSGTSA